MTKVISARLLAVSKVLATVVMGSLTAVGCTNKSEVSYINVTLVAAASHELLI